MSNKKTLIKRSSCLIARYDKDNIIILDPNAGKLYTFNQVAASIYKFLWKARTIEEIIQRVRNEFKVSSQTAEKDVTEFVEKALENKLVNIIKNKNS